MAHEPPGPVIDLGELDAPAEPTGTPVRRPRPRGWLAAVMAATLATVTAAAAPAPPRLDLLFSVPAGPDGIRLVTADTLYASDVAVGGNPAPLSAYDLRDGSRRWSVPQTRALTGLRLAGTGGPLLAVASDNTVSVLDPATGAERWRQTGDPWEVSPRGVIFVDTDTDGRIERIRAADPHTGRPRWSAENTLPTAAFFADEAAGLLYLVGADGTAIVHRWADGIVATRARLAASPTDDDSWTDLRLFEGALFVVVNEAGRATVIVHDALTLAERWRQTFAGPGGVDDCAPYACLSTADGLAALDPGTGATRWRISGWRSPYPIPGGPTVVIAAAEERYATLDVRTGATRQLSAWQTFPDAGPWTLRADTAAQRRVVVGRIGADGAVGIVGAVEPVDPDSCLGHDRYLSCRNVNGQLLVWRVGQPADAG